MSQNNQSQYSAAEVYAFEFQRSEPSHYTMIPNIIDHLTYETVDKKGKKIQKKLSVYAKELYRIIRMTASDKGACWRCTKSLAEIMNCSTGTVFNAKKELMQSMLELDGKKLIIETRSHKIKIKDDKCIGKQILCKYSITDIWCYNNAYMATINHKKWQQADSPHESDIQADSPHESASQGADSPHEPNNKDNKIHLFNKQQPTAEAASVCSSQKKELFENLFVGTKTKNDTDSTEDFLLKNKCDPKVAKQMSKKYTKNEILQAMDYFMKQSAKNKIKGKSSIQNKWAYLTQILKNRYWENV